MTAWSPFWAHDETLDAIETHADLYQYASPFDYTAKVDGTIALKTSAASHAAAVRRLRAAGVPVVPAVSSGVSDRDMPRFLGDAGVRSRHVNRLVDLAVREPYDGIDINYESFAVSIDAALSARNRDSFSAFVAELCPALRAKGKLCTIVVMARVDDAMQASYRPSLAVGVFDYAAIGRHADRVRIMTYDQHHPSGRPGPMAGWEWMHTVLDYALERIPADRIELGIPVYGRDWGTGDARSIKTKHAADLVRRNGGMSSWHPRHLERHGTYRSDGVRHDVWWSDAEAIGRRVQVARDHGLAGVALWVPGYADAAVWREIRDVLRDGSRPVAGFHDVRTGMTFADDVAWLAAEGITRGCGNDRFCPREAVLREQMAAFLRRTVGEDPADPWPRFTDVVPGSTFAADIAWLDEQRITNGCGPDTFCPDDPVTRGQTAAFLRRTLGSPRPQGGSRFRDVSATHRFAVDIAWLDEERITNGCGPDTFCPERTLTRQEMAAFLHRTFGR